MGSMHVSQDRTGHSESLTPLQAVSQLCPRLHSLNVSMCSGFSMHALIRVVRHLREAGRLRKLQMDELQVRVLIWVSATLMGGSKRGTSIRDLHADQLLSLPQPKLAQG